MEVLKDEQNPLYRFRDWAKGLIGKVRKLKELARSEIYTCMGSNLVKGVHHVGIPPPLQNYLLDIS